MRTLCTPSTLAFKHDQYEMRSFQANTMQTILLVSLSVKAFFELKK